MKKQLISPTDYKTSNWSGGETTELFLYPPNGDYGTRQFDYRVSTAKVNLAQSDFTSLDGFERLIMSLDNPLELHHTNEFGLRKVMLQPFEVNRFRGSEKTKSFGTCQDFNLIFSDELEGDMAIKYTESVTQTQSGVTYIYYALKPLKLELLGQETREVISLKSDEMIILSELEAKERIAFTSEVPSNDPIVIEVIVH